MSYETQTAEKIEKLTALCGQTVKLVYCGGLAMTISATVKLLSVSVRDYAQYRNVISITYVLRGKRKPCGQILPDTVLILPETSNIVAESDAHSSFSGNALVNICYADNSGDVDAIRAEIDATALYVGEHFKSHAAFRKNQALSDTHAAHELIYRAHAEQYNATRGHAILSRILQNTKTK